MEQKDSANEVRVIDLSKNDLTSFSQQYVGCLVLTKDNQIMLQQRPNFYLHYPSYLCEFGGKLKKDEQPVDALVRELKEELGANVNPKDAVSFGAITEPTLDDKDLIHTFFWHDKHGSITGCYEDEARYFNKAADVLTAPKMTEGLKWLLKQCVDANLIKP